MGTSCLHPIGGNFVAPGGAWNVWSSKHINPEIAARQHLEWQELTREGKETESLTGLTGGLDEKKLRRVCFLGRSWRSSLSVGLGLFLLRSQGSNTSLWT